MATYKETRLKNCKDLIKQIEQIEQIDGKGERGLSINEDVSREIKKVFEESGSFSEMAKRLMESKYKFSEFELGLYLGKLYGYAYVRNELGKCGYSCGDCPNPKHISGVQ